jgi:lysozyme family protein
MWGVATHVYPDILASLPADIRGAMPALVRDLTKEQAQTIFFYRYWSLVRADDLPPGLALVVADSAYNNGVPRASKWLQSIVGAAADGVVGNKTISMVKAYIAKNGWTALASEFNAQRLHFMACLDLWKEDGLGWSRRLCAIPYQSLLMTGP